MGAGLTGTVPMTARRIVAMIVGVPLLLLIIGWFALTMIAHAGQDRFRVGLELPARGRSAHVAVDSGTLRVSQGTDARLRVAGVAWYSLIRPVVTSRETPTSVRAVSKCRFAVLKCSFRYRVTVPAGSPVTLINASGDIIGSRLASSVLSASADSGSVRLTFAVVPRSVKITDSFGDVTLVLPRGPAAYRVTTRAPSGKTTVRVPTSPSSPHVITVTDRAGRVWISN